jgi:3-methyl-2-oxobutanoate hydroxymethyltransferase
MRTTLDNLAAMKRTGEKIVMLTAYDFPSALLAERAGVPVLLVGDSLGMVMHGHDTTLPVSLDMMVLHAGARRTRLSSPTCPFSATPRRTRRWRPPGG